jgi:hypothetical protein
MSVQSPPTQPVAVYLPPGAAGLDAARQGLSVHLGIPAAGIVVSRVPGQDSLVQLTVNGMDGNPIKATL